MVDPEDCGHEEAEARLAAALPVLSAAARRTVSGEVGDAEPRAAIQDALNRESLHEIIVSTLPARVSRWLHLDLPSKARGLGVPVTHVEAREIPATHAA